MAIPVLGGIWQLARRVENLFQDVAKLVQGLAAVRDELRQLERRVTALEGREDCSWRRHGLRPPWQPVTP
jgi:hypothetical protein